MNGHRSWAWALTTLVVFAPLTRAQAANTTTVIERGTQYVPGQVDVAVGDTVQWIYESSPPGTQGHTVTFNDKDLNPNCPSVLLSDCQRGPSDRVSRTFASAGTYPYRCKIQAGMTGVVVVTAAGGSSSSTTGPASSTTGTVKSSTTTTTTRAATSSTTATTRALATSSTVLRSTTTTSDPSSALLPGAAPPFSGDDTSSNAAAKKGGSGGSDTGTVALIVAALLAASAGGGFLLWRLRPGRT